MIIFQKRVYLFIDCFEVQNGSLQVDKDRMYDISRFEDDYFDLKSDHDDKCDVNLIYVAPMFCLSLIQRSYPTNMI